MKNKTIHIFHHNDADGYAAAILCWKKHRKESTIEFVEMDYSKKFPIETIKPEDKVYIVDFSIEPEDMIKLLKITKDVIWIDHHATAIKKYDDWNDLIEEATGVKRIKGMRVDGIAGCELTWLYLFDNYEDLDEKENVIYLTDKEELLYELDLAPLYIKLVGDWDTWRHNIPDSRPFQMALSNNLSYTTMMKLDEDAYEEVYLKQIDRKCPAKIMDIDRTKLLKEMIEIGKTYTEYRNNWATQLRKRYGFETTLRGPEGELYKAYMLNVGNANSDYFGEELDNHDLVCTFCYNGSRVNYSMYSNKDHVHCGDLCRYYGVDNGGGHRGAAGFTSDKFLF